MDFQSSTIWVCAVSVATVWTSPQSTREIDTPGLENPVRLNPWLEKLTFEPRLELCDGDRVQTQLLYGEPVIVEEISEGWAKVFIPWQSSKKDSRGYPGWVPAVQLKEMERISTSDFAKVSVSKAQLWSTDGTPLIVLSLNTILPVIKQDADFTYVHTPHGGARLRKCELEVANSVESFRKGSGEDVISKAVAFLDLPYFWGGMSTYGYDCSGFSYNMLKANGYFIPRDASNQALDGEAISVDEMDEWQRGDLLFFAYEEGKGSIHHVGIYFGNGQMIHSPNTGKSIEIIDLANTIHEKELCAVRRYFVDKGANE